MDEMDPISLMLLHLYIGNQMEICDYENAFAKYISANEQQQVVGKSELPLTLKLN